jgi:hypothetical protein
MMTIGSTRTPSVTMADKVPPAPADGREERATNTVRPSSPDHRRNAGKVADVDGDEPREGVIRCVLEKTAVAIPTGEQRHEDGEHEGPE